MFFSFAVVLAVTLAVVSASQPPKEEAVHSVVHFDALDVPVQAGFAAKVLKLRAAQHKKHAAERAARDAKKVSEGKKERSTNVAQGKTVLTPVTTSYWVQKSHSNSDCSGPVVSTYIEKMDRCVSLGVSDSMRSTCSGLQVTHSYFTEEDDCTGDSYNAAENHDSCDFDVYSYEAMGRVLMSSNTCVDSDPAQDLQSGLLIKYYDTENCVGDYAYAYNQHLNVCAFMQEENGDYFYYKILGCDGDRITMVGYSDRNCQRPFVKDVDPVGAPTCDYQSKTQCVVWA